MQVGRVVEAPVISEAVARTIGRLVLIRAVEKLSRMCSEGLKGHDRLWVQFISSIKPSDEIPVFGKRPSCCEESDVIIFSKISLYSQDAKRCILIDELIEPTHFWILSDAQRIFL